MVTLSKVIHGTFYHGINVPMVFMAVASIAEKEIDFIRGYKSYVWMTAYILWVHSLYTIAFRYIKQ